jgi:hypothetical protein
VGNPHHAAHLFQGHDALGVYKSLEFDRCVGERSRVDDFEELVAAWVDGGSDQLLPRGFDILDAFWIRHWTANGLELLWTLYPAVLL